MPDKRALAGIAGLSAAGTVLSRVTGLGRTIFQATTLGASGVSDAYNLANTTPNLIYDLVLGGVLAGTLVPVFVRALNDDDWDAISAVCSTVLAVLGATTVLFLAGTPWIVRFYTVGAHSAGAERRLAISLLFLFVPQLAGYGITAVATAILAARRSYAFAMYTPVLNNVIVIVVLLWFGALVAHPTVARVRGDGAAVLLLGLGTTAGVVVMTGALLVGLWRDGARIRWVWNPSHPAVRTILRLSAWTAGVVVANQVTYLVIVVLTNRKVGDYTAWSYAYQFFLLPHAVWMVSLLGPMETEASHQWQAGDRPAARRHLLETGWMGMVLIVPAALGYAVLARPVISLVLQHGNMSAHGARVTADTLAVLALGLPLFSGYMVLMRMYQAMQDTRTMFLVYVGENALNIVLAFVLYPTFGVQGLAAAWGLSYGVGAVGAAWHVGRRLGGAFGPPGAAALGRLLVGGLVAAGFAFAVSHALDALPVVVRVLSAVLVGAAAYYVAATVLEFPRIRSKLLR